MLVNDLPIFRMLLAALGCGAALSAPLLLLQSAPTGIDQRYHLALAAIIGGSLLGCAAHLGPRDHR